MDRGILLMWGCGIALVTAAMSYCLARISGCIARRVGAVDAPTGGRKIHAMPMPLWGGLGIACAIGVMSFALFPRVSSMDVRPVQILGYLIGVGILLLGGMLDDLRPLSARVQIMFPLLAALSVVMTGTGIVQVTHPFQSGAFSLVWGDLAWTVNGIQMHLSVPADLLTFAWILVATYAMKILDGLDGLVTGMTVIGAGIVGALSAATAYYQPSVALLSSIIGGAYLGFLPRNSHPAKQFLGEAGSTIAGFSLAVLAIFSGTKIAIALTVLAIPIMDACIVVIGRLKRGHAWYAGDATHLHHRLIRAGMSQRVAVWLYWGVALTAGIFALSLQTRGKIFLILLLGMIAIFASFVAGMRARK